jgi:Zn finger protein HypA/HybF involved in hydrogenase expression
MDTLSFENNIETGRVEKGNVSDQTFQTVNKSFNNYTTATSVWKILPMSQKVYEKQELKVYCGNCGTKKRRNSHLFCPHCGEKY